MTLSRIHYTKPSIGLLEQRYASDAVANGWGERCYEYISKFEQAFRDHLGTKHAIATSSCTGAMHMGLAALGIGPGDEVIIGDINWIASAAPILYLGAKPNLVDVLDDTWCIDPDAVVDAITPRTKAIVAVHVYGNLCNMDRLRQIAEDHGLALIEDAAEAIGSMWHGRRAGSMGTFGTFSFHGTKTVTTGEGGMFVTNDTDLYERVLTLSNHGRSRNQTKQFWPDLLGYKYKISNVQAAIGCAQMERVEELIAGKRRIFEYYRDRFEGLPLRMNPEPDGTQNSYWMPTIVVDEDVPFSRERLLQDFQSNSIDGRVFFWPLSLLPMFHGYSKNPVSHSLYARAINLPTYHDIRDDELDRVIEVVASQFL
ncbi:MAG: glutamine--scyllo-inositol aminotransferase [Hyphomicrobium sp. 32-62-53]|nr:MAG: glutamine--scyllo-inositol aminotransferase [Hyphomicrobium sp. 12-62-95]OYX97217.1 MAG: glutamine--scyllo-inositol aminotransferase [Hyphomicrobium sp. 32-62-53]